MFGLKSVFSMCLPKKNRFSLGLDVGSSYIKTVLLTSDSEGNFELAGYSIEKVLDNKVEAIRMAFDRSGAKENKVVSSLAGASVVARYIELPIMTDKELSTAIEFEAEKVIPYNIDEVIIDYYKTENIDDKKMRLILAAAKKDLVFERVRILNAANIQPRILDMDAFAVMNAFTASSKSASEISALLNIGANITNLNIIKGERSFLCRDINFGSMEELPIEIKQDDQKAINGMINMLADEVRLSFDFFENHFGETIKTIYISGGLAKIGAVSGILKNEFDCDVLKWNWAQSIKIREGLSEDEIYKDYPQLALAYGLALRGF